MDNPIPITYLFVFPVSHSGFYRPQSVLDFMIDVLNHYHGGRRRQDQGPTFQLKDISPTTQLRQDWVVSLNKALKRKL